MDPIGKLIKLLLAITAGAVLLLGARSFAADPKPEGSRPAATATKGRVVEIAITEKGYEPSPIKLKKGEPVTLRLTRKTEKTCATEIILKEHGINAELPLNKPVEVSFTPDKTGTLKYGCAMGMMIAGQLIVE